MSSQFAKWMRSIGTNDAKQYESEFQRLTVAGDGNGIAEFFKWPKKFSEDEVKSMETTREWLK